MSGKKVYLAAIITIAVLSMLIFAGPKGLKRWRDYQQLRQEEARWHFQKAENLLKLREYQKALAEYEIVITRYHHSELIPEVLLQMGFIYTRYLGKDDLARQSYERLIKDYPRSPQLIKAKTNLLYLCQRLDRNKEVIQLSTDLTSNYSDQIDRDAVCLVAAETYCKEGNQEQALKMADQIVNKNSPLVKNSQIYYSLQLSRNPFDPNPHYELARIYRGLGLEQKARDELNVAARLKQRQKNFPPNENQKNTKPK